VFLLVQSLTTGDDGHITFPDMEMGALYKLVEEQPPNGYAILAKEIYFRMASDADKQTLVFCDAAGNVISAPIGVSGEYITLNGLLVITVKNLRGYALPSTGGIGIPIYMLCGLILTLAPLVYVINLRRKYGRRSQQ
jgi:hypothetical protein